MSNSTILSKLIIQQAVDRKVHWQKLVKLLFLVDMAAIRVDQNNQGMSGLKFIAAENGPVPAEYVEFVASLTADGEITLEGDFFVAKETIVLDGETLSNEDFSIVHQVLSRFADWNWTKLSNFCHELPAWFRTKRNEIIDPSLMRYNFRIGEPELVNAPHP